MFDSTFVCFTKYSFPITKFMTFITFKRCDKKDHEAVLEKQLSTVKRVYQIYYQQKAFANVIEEETTNSFIDIVRYASQYFNTEDG